MNLTSNAIPPGFDTDFALKAALPIAQAAYAVMHAPDDPPQLPQGWDKTALIKAHAGLLADLAERLRLVQGEPEVFGLMGKNTKEKIAFISFRGTQDPLDWAHNTDSAKTAYQPVAGVGDVHHGFQSIYMTLRQSIQQNLAAACARCDQLLVTGHSLGGALAVLSALELAGTVPAAMAIALVTFAGPRAGCVDFSRSFNNKIQICYRVVATADVVPHIPIPAPPEFPYEHVGTEIHVDGGQTDAVQAHSLDNSYKPGLEKLQSLAMGRGAGG
jgi:triacylglycerol lipase